MVGSASCDLARMGVLVTRPAQQAQGLCRLITAHGGRPLLFPVMDILPPLKPTAALGLLASPWDILVYVSANAVQFAAALNSRGRLPQAGRVAAVGKATARALADAGCAADLVPREADSEGLLALPELQQVAGRRILIVRGEGGRAHLGDTLSRRGADVHYAEVYRRVRPTLESGPLIARWGRDVQVVTATSQEVLENLQALLGEEARSMLHRTPLVAISERMAQAAETMGFARVRVAAGADDQSLLNALCAEGESK